jgi:hypothetical protein
MHWIHGWGLAYGIYPWGNVLGIGDLMGRRFGWVVGFFLGGAGEGKMLQDVANGDPDPRSPGADTCVVRDSTARRPGSRIDDGEGDVLLVPSRTPRISGYVCYMSSSRVLLLYVYVCYMLLYVICL